MRKRLPFLIACGYILATLSGCDTTTGTLTEGIPQRATVQEPVDVQYYASDEPLRLGIEHFARGQYGTAEKYFRDAVEKAPRDATAWNGLAASYDRLRRFDLADQAYAQVAALTGETVQLLNNRGYSFLLRGDTVRARQQFLKAYELDPTNKVVLSNLELLNSSSRFIQRTAL